jgi:hypothetical protein
MSGTPETQKANLQIVGNLILNGAGGSYFPAAAQSVLAQTVSNAAQPNITSVGTLTSLDVSGNITAANANLGNLVVANFFSGDGGFLSNLATYGNTDVANYLPNYTGNIGSSNISVTNDLNVSGTTTLGPVNTGYIGAGGNVSVPNADYFVGNLRTNTISSVSNVSVVTDAGNINATWVFGAGGALYWPGPYQWAIEPNSSDEFEIHSHSNVVISTDTSNSNLHFTFDTDGIFRAPSNVVLSGTTLFVGPNAEAAGNALSSPTLVISSTSNTYSQAVLINEDNSGSSDWIAQGADGTDTEGYSDFGFNGNTFADANYSLTGAGDGYFFVETYSSGTGGNLVIATGTNGANRDIVFGTGGFTANAEFARMSDANNAFELYRANAAVVATIVKTTPVTVSALPAAATAGAGARAFVTDADSTTFNAPAVGGAGNAMPVFSNGTGWFIG